MTRANSWLDRLPEQPEAGLRGEAPLGWVEDWGVRGAPPLSDKETRASTSVSDERASWHGALKRGCSWHWSGWELSHPLRCPPPSPPRTSGGGREEAPSLTVREGVGLRTDAGRGGEQTRGYAERARAGALKNPRGRSGPGVCAGASGPR